MKGGGAAGLAAIPNALTDGACVGDLRSISKCICTSIESVASRELRSNSTRSAGVDTSPLASEGIINRTVCLSLLSFYAGRIRRILPAFPLKFVACNIVAFARHKYIALARRQLYRRPSINRQAGPCRRCGAY